MPHSDGVRRFAFAAVLVLCATAALAQSASVSIMKVAAPNPLPAGQDLTYDVTASNEGPDDAQNLTMSDPLPAGTTFASFTAPAGWSCMPPTLAPNGTVTCTAP